MKGKGQVTLFVILGILIIALISTYLYIRSETTEGSLQATLHKVLYGEEPKKLIVRSAASTVRAGLSQAKDLLNPLARLFSPKTLPPSLSPPEEEPEKPAEEKTSACATPPSPPTPSPEVSLSLEQFPHTFVADQYAYYFNMGGVETIPSLEEFSQMFAEKIKKDVPYILSQIPTSLTKGFEIWQDQIQAQVIITDDAIKTTLTVPICAEGEPVTPEKAKIEIKTRFAQMLEFARWIVQQDLQHPDYLDLSALEDEADRRNMKVSIAEEDNARIYTLIDMDPDVDQTLLTLPFVSILT